MVNNDFTGYLGHGSAMGLVLDQVQREFEVTDHNRWPIAAVIAHRCLSPNRSVWSAFKVLQVCVIRGKCVFVILFWYDWQEVRKCSLVSSWFCVQCEPSKHE